MGVLERWARGDSQLLSKHDAQPVVDSQRLCDVPRAFERLHQNPVPGLAEGSELDELIRGGRGLRQLRPADGEAGRCDALQPTDSGVVETSAPIF